MKGFNRQNQLFFCVAVNLLELQELQTVLREIDRKPDMETLTLKEGELFLSDLGQDSMVQINGQMN